MKQGFTLIELSIGLDATWSTVSSTATCYDNGNVNGVIQQYSLEVSGGGNINCALAFQFQ